MRRLVLLLAALASAALLAFVLAGTEQTPEPSDQRGDAPPRPSTGAAPLAGIGDPAHDDLAPEAIDAPAAGSSAAREHPARAALGRTEIAVEVTCDGVGAEVEVLVLGPSVYETLRTDASGRAALEVEPGEYEILLPRDGMDAFVPAGAGSEAEVTVDLGERATATLSVARPASLTLELPEGHRAPTSHEIVTLYVEDGSKWVRTNRTPRGVDHRTRWEGLDPGHYRLRVALFEGATADVTLESGEERTVELDLGLEPFTLTVEACARATGARVRVPIGVSLRFDPLAARGALRQSAINAVLESGEARTFLLPPGPLEVLLSETSNHPTLVSDLRVADGPGRRFDAAVSEVGGAHVHGITIDVPEVLAVLELRFEDPRPPGTSYNPMVTIPGRAEPLWLDVRGTHHLALDLARLEGGELLIHDGHVDRGRVIWSEVPRAGWTDQVILMTR